MKDHNAPKPKFRKNYNVYLRYFHPIFFSLLTLNMFSQETGEDYVKEPFFDDFDGETVNTDVWQVASWSEHGGKTSPDRCFVDDGYLNMVFINDSEDGYLSAAIQTRNEFLFGKWEARLKPSSVPGVLNSFYTIDWNNTADESSSGNGTKQEIDIEFLTYTFGNSDGKIHYAVHAADKESFNLNPDISLGFDPSAGFHVYGFEVTPEYIEWFVDDQVLQKYTYNGNDITIYAPYQLKLNVWSKESWINGPPEADVECLYLIDWIKFTPAGNNARTHTIKNDRIMALHNYPDPFNESTTVEFILRQPSIVNFSVYNTSGQLVFYKEMGTKTAGKHTFRFNGANLGPGIYSYCISTNNGCSVNKFIVTE